MSIISNEPVYETLLEKKKKQWAKEKEEMTNLVAPWCTDSSKKYHKNKLRALQLNSLNEKFYLENNSLPPILNKPHEIYDRGGETSGYASDCAQQLNQTSGEYWPNRRRSIGVWSVRQDGPNSPDSVSTISGLKDEQRLKWGDRGVGVGHLWEPNEINERPSYHGDGSPPGWVQRGLNNSEVIVINHSSSEDTEHSTSASFRTYIRGQNAPLDEAIIEERELKRKKAIEHQNAIRQQLEEKERIRNLERERQQREEKLEEERIMRECKKERERMLAEEKYMNEKIERERKRNELMKHAIEEAERQAKLEKLKKKYARMNYISENEDVESININDLKLENKREENTKEIACYKNEEEAAKYHSTSSEENYKKYDSQCQTIKLNSPKKSQSSACSVATDTSQNLNTLNLQLPINFMNHDGLPVLIQPNSFPSIDPNMNSMQYAYVMATPNIVTSIPSIQNQYIAIPVSATQQNAAFKLNSFNTSLVENRILTPTKYRNQIMFCDACTQTEKEDFEILNRHYHRDYNNRYGSLDRQIFSKKYVKRIRSEDRSSLARQERPKWGVNRPPTQYLTQSEKDPLYLRRKLRQKLRGLKLNETSKDSSEDDSRSLSPNDNKHVYKRNERTLLSQNLNVYQTEVIPIESDSRGRLILGKKNITTKRQSISEKFLIAKRNESGSSTRCNKGTSPRNPRKDKLNKQNELKKRSSTDSCCEDTEVWINSDSINIDRNGNELNYLEVT